MNPIVTGILLSCLITVAGCNSKPEAQPEPGDWLSGTWSDGKERYFLTYRTWDDEKPGKPPAPIKIDAVPSSELARLKQKVIEWGEKKPEVKKVIDRVGLDSRPEPTHVIIFNPDHKRYTHRFVRIDPKMLSSSPRAGDALILGEFDNSKVEAYMEFMTEKQEQFTRESTSVVPSK